MNQNKLDLRFTCRNSMSSHGRQKMEGGEREKKEKTVQIFKKFCCQKKKKKKSSFSGEVKKKNDQKIF